MRWISESVEKLIALAGDDAIHEAIIVGSGYGGAVSALRLAQAGLNPIVLERGREYLAGEFPNDIAELPAHVRMQRWDSKDVSGYESGLFDFRIGKDVAALVGNALGGGSQINASAAVEPDPRTFAQPEWPKTIRTTPNPLSSFFSIASAALGVETFPGELNGAAPKEPLAKFIPLKYTALKELASELGCAMKFENTPLAVRFNTPQINLPPPGTTLYPQEICIGCGDCVSGCNYSAKRTLTTTYLPQARDIGARMFTGVTVLHIARAKNNQTWEVWYQRTEARKRERAGVQITRHKVVAKQVILAAGTFGSTEILLRSRERGLKLSKKLGEQVSTNGDNIVAGYLKKQRINGIGAGSERVYDQGLKIGPTITSQIRIDDTDDLSRSVLIQDSVIPGAIAGIFHELVTTVGVIAQLDKKHYLAAPGADPLAIQPEGLAQTQVLLAMGHDDAKGVIGFDTARDSVRLDYPGIDQMQVFKIQETYLKKVAGEGEIYLQNPVLYPIPDAVRSILSGPRIGGGAITVHPLGGCVMGDSIDKGVVDEYGRVFNPDSTDIKAPFHSGLFVLDGSIIPRALGVNPLLTITALAERAMAQCFSPRAPAAGGQLPRYPEGQPVPPPQAYYRPANLPIPVHFTEVMRGEASFADDVAGKAQWNTHLVLHFPVADVKRFFSDADHKINIEEFTAIDKEQLPAQLLFQQPDWRANYDQAPQKGEVSKEYERRFDVVGGAVRILPVEQVRLLQRLLNGLRTAITWFILRGADEIIRKGLELLRSFTGALRRRGPAMDMCEPVPEKISIPSYVSNLIKLVRHASENRTIEYRLILNEEISWDRHTLTGRKALDYAASWSAIGRYVMRRLHLAPWPEGANEKGFMKPLLLDRRNLWKAFGCLDFQLFDATGKPIAAGDLTFDAVDMTRRHAPQLPLMRDTLNALVAFSGYPLLFARLMIKTRLWDFILPDYPKAKPVEFHTDDQGNSTNDTQVPCADSDSYPTPWPKFPALRIVGDTKEDGKDRAEQKAEPSVKLLVQRSRKNESKDVELRLTRYRQKQLRTKSDDGKPLRVKSIILLNGFAQSTLPFVAQELTRAAVNTVDHDEPNLAEFFFEQGFDVWLFDYRTSSILEASKLPSSLDDIAEFDIPAAVDHVLATLRCELKTETDTQLQIYMYAHCVGAASAAMSVLGGYLSYGTAGDASRTPKLAGLALSQMQMFLVGGKTGQMRIQAASLLRDAAKLDYLRLSAAERRATAFESVLDRLFATLPVDQGEQCPHEHDRISERPGIATCKRMTGFISRLLAHDRIKEETHNRLPIYFGRANTTLLVHGGRCVEYERLVNADGQNVYVTEENIRKYLRVPVALIHGARNVLFDKESCERTFNQIRRINGDWSDDHFYAQPIIAKDFAHFDTTIGYGRDGNDGKMQAQILRPLRDFYNQAWDRNWARPAVSAQEICSRAKPPLAGPVIGWTRTQPNGTQPNGKRLIRVWMQVDDTETDEAVHVLTAMGSSRQATPYQALLWPVLRVPVETLPLDICNVTAMTTRPSGAFVSIGVADIEFDPKDLDLADGFVIDMASIHEFSKLPSASARVGVPTNPTNPTSPTNSQSPIARPLTKEELGGLSNPNPGLPMFFDPSVRLDALTPFASTLTNAATMPAASLSLEEDTAQRAVPVLTGLPLDPGAAAELLSVMQHARVLGNSEAISAKPLTLSRKRRLLANDYLDYRITVPKRMVGGPDTGDAISFVASSCRYPGLAFEDLRANAAMRRIAKIAAASDTHRDALFLLGDQIYADATAAVIDTAEQVEKVTTRYRDAFSSPGFRAACSSIPTYMVMDDHEIDDNWSLDYAATPDGKRLHDTARACFSAFQWSHSPRNLSTTGFDYSFDIGDYAFFALDTRSNRIRFGAGGPSLIDATQMRALDAWLAAQAGDGRPKFILSGSVLLPGLWEYEPGAGSSSEMLADNWQMAAGQRAAVLKTICDHKVRNVVFIAGDYHCDAITEIDLSQQIKAYSIVTPPLYAPFPAANVKPDQVMTQPLPPIPTGGPSFRSAPRSGNGFADVHITPLPGNRWTLEIVMHRIDWASEQPAFEETRTTYNIA